MSLSAYYDPPEFEDNGGNDKFYDHEAARNQRIADLAQTYRDEALAGKGDFWPGKLRSDGAVEPPEWDLEQALALFAALRDSFADPDDPAGAQLRYAKAISDAISDYATRRATEEVE